MVWPNYLLPPPLQPLQLSEYLSTGSATTLHQHHHTQTHSTRLVALASADASGLPKTRTTRMTSVKLEETSPGKQEAVVTAHLVYHQDAGTGSLNYIILLVLFIIYLILFICNLFHICIVDYYLFSRNFPCRLLNSSSRSS